MLWLEDVASILDAPNETDVLPTSLAFAQALSHKCQILYVQVPIGIICMPVDVDNETIFKESCNENSCDVSCFKWTCVYEQMSEYW